MGSDYSKQCEYYIDLDGNSTCMGANGRFGVCQPCIYADVDEQFKSGLIADCTLRENLNSHSIVGINGIVSVVKKVEEKAITD